MKTKIGSIIDEKERKVVKGIPPIVLQLQVDGFVVLEKPEELKQWEDDVKLFHGVEINASSLRACETCSGGCSDDCGILRK
jgi:hypothetical protein